jgi:hypothetical protein
MIICRTLVIFDNFGNYRKSRKIIKVLQIIMDFCVFGKTFQNTMFIQTAASFKGMRKKYIPYSKLAITSPSQKYQKIANLPQQNNEQSDNRSKKL